MKGALSKRFTFLRSCDVLLFAMSLERRRLWEICLLIPLYVAKPIASNGTYHSALVTKNLIFPSQFLVFSRPVFIRMWQIPYPYLDGLAHKISDCLSLTWLPQIKTDNLKEGRNIKGKNGAQLDLKNSVFTRQDRFILKNLLSMLLLKAQIYLK